jgi:hypothetical protein
MPIAHSSIAPAAEAICVYGFVRAVSGADAACAVTLRRNGGIGALLSRVPLDDFHGAAAERHLADPAWIVPRIRRHAEIVECAMACSPVFPMPFATLYSSLDALDQVIRRHRATIGEFLDLVTDRQEWTLRVTPDVDDLPFLDTLAGQTRPGWSSQAPGLRYLRLRRERPALLALAASRAAAMAEALIGALRPLATRIRALPETAAAPQAAGFALLVPTAQGGALQQQVRALAAAQPGAGLRIALSGPTPPYSFRPALDPPPRQEVA